MTHQFKVGQTVKWMYNPGGARTFPKTIFATVVKITAKRIRIEISDTYTGVPYTKIVKPEDIFA